MYQYILQIHSINRYLVLALLLIVVVSSFIAWVRNSNYTKFNKISLSLLTSFTHLQFLLGTVLSFISPWVKFSSDVMKDDMMRYWAVEHLTIMLMAVIFISIPGLTVKKLDVSKKKHRRTAIWTGISLVLILAAIMMCGRGII